MGNAFIPLSVPNLSGREKEYVNHAVEIGWVSTGGQYVTDFENKVAAYCKSPGAVACQNGTAALHLCLLLCGVTRNDLVIAPTLTFIAAINPINYIGAEPVFMDCDEQLCIDPVKVERYCAEDCHVSGDALYENATGKRVSAMVIVHVFGNMAQMEALMDIAARYHLKVIEDATEAIGTHYTTGRYAGKYAGTIGDVGAFSFNGNKIITTGGGGMIVSQDVALLKHAKHLTTQAKSDEAYFEHDEIGYNYRLTNLQAALGLAQMEQLDGFIAHKKYCYDVYKQAVSQIPGLHLLGFREGVDSNHWFYSLYCEDSYALNRDQLIQLFQAHNIQTRPIWGLIHLQKPYGGSRSDHIERAVDFRAHVVNLPCSTNLTDSDLDRVIACLK